MAELESETRSLASEPIFFPLHSSAEEIKKKTNKQRLILGVEDTEQEY